MLNFVRFLHCFKTIMLHLIEKPCLNKKKLYYIVHFLKITFTVLLEIVKSLFWRNTKTSKAKQSKAESTEYIVNIRTVREYIVHCKYQDCPRIKSGEYRVYCNNQLTVREYRVHCKHQSPKFKRVSSNETPECPFWDLNIL